MPFRKCAGCNQLKDTSGLIRITKVHGSGEIVVKPDSRTFGRSVYVCYNKECLKVSIKKKRLQKALKKDISNEIIEHLERLAELPQG